MGPITMFGAKVITMIKEDDEKLKITEKIILRSILGPLKIAVE